MNIINLGIGPSQRQLSYKLSATELEWQWANHHNGAPALPCFTFSPLDDADVAAGIEVQ
jgi:hypothetical protein